MIVLISLHYKIILPPVLCANPVCKSGLSGFRTDSFDGFRIVLDWSTAFFANIFKISETFLHMLGRYPANPGTGQVPISDRHGRYIFWDWIDFENKRYHFQNCWGKPQSDRKFIFKIAKLRNMTRIILSLHTFVRTGSCRNAPRFSSKGPFLSIILPHQSFHSGSRQEKNTRKKYVWPISYTVVKCAKFYAV
jgi:hypothetical protein